MGFKRVVLDKRVCRFVLVFYFFLALIPSTGEASLIESRLSTGEAMSERSEKIEAVRKALEHKVVAQRLADYGLSQEEVMARMQTMDDEQLHQLASLSDEIGGGGFGAVIAVLIIVLLIVLILKLSDRRIVIQ
ncbi:PA2779 family protein [Desulfonatronovibrio hydrogenovorans]|uniref:PA2779 family protein n=1 Tax=Desulfonatronovibrio hydrogenovorans TaxID=53245 RepID=UPI00048F2BFD|nr:PA2779 family protein [Desulfonatronovibrio hydrogenovorans]